MKYWQTKLPEPVIGRAKSLGAAGQAWLDELDPLINELESTWNIRVTDVLGGGSHAFIGSCTDNAGRENILKIELPDYDQIYFQQGADMLERANGNGYCRLYAVNAARRAMLLEKLGEPLSCSGKSTEEQIHILCNALLKTWQLPLCSTESGRTNANYHWFKSFIPSAWQQQEKPCAGAVVDTALRYVTWLEDRTNPAQYVWVHGDVHANNMLRVPGTTNYKLIDPDGKIFEKSYDVGVLMREWPKEYAKNPLEQGRMRSRMLSGLTNVPEEEIWAWGYLQMVATALILLQIGQKELAQTMLRIAEAWT